MIKFPFQILALKGSLSKTIYKRCVSAIVAVIALSFGTKNTYSLKNRKYIQI